MLKYNLGNIKYNLNLYLFIKQYLHYYIFN